LTSGRIIAEILNSGNVQSQPAVENDVTVVGGGIHGLMYAIQAHKVHPEANLKISVFEKAPKPQWKVRK
jgi:predicted flavoprotein YhiN